MRQSVLFVSVFSIVTIVATYVYRNGKTDTANQDLGVKFDYSVGTFVGQLLSGWLGDVVRRRRVSGIDLACPPFGVVCTILTLSNFMLCELSVLQLLKEVQNDIF